MTTTNTLTAPKRQASPAGKNIYWRDHEIDRVVWALEDMVRKFPDKPLRSLIDLAQEAALPAHRRKTSRSPALYGKRFYRLFTIARQRGLSAGRLAEDPPKAPPVPAPDLPEQLPEPAPTLYPSRSPVPESEPAPEPEPPREPVLEPVDLSGIESAALIGELVMRAVSHLGGLIDQRLAKIEEAFVGGLHRGTPIPLSPTRPPVETSRREDVKPKPPILTIVGLFRDQFEHVVEKCKETGFDLRWVDKERSMPAFPTTDYIIVQEHSRHRWWDAAKRAVPSDHLAFADGCVSKVVQRVFDFHSRRIAMAAR